MTLRIGIKSVGIRGWKSLWQGYLVTHDPAGEHDLEPVGEPSLDPEEVRTAVETERSSRLAQAAFQEAA